MATIMTKRGQLDNVVTYEHICDTVADMANINPSYVTLGSVCIVIKGENDDLEVYMADSRKEWKIISSSSGESGSISSSGIHICAQDEYDSVTGMPTIEDPLSNTFYLTPGGSETNDLYNEWIWLEDDEEWEKFGSATTAISQPDWNQSDSSADDFIKNKPAIRQQANGGILENNATDASGVRSHAEGDMTVASGWGAHAEGNQTVASGSSSHAEGEGTEASGGYSHAEGCGTIAKCYAQHVFGEYNEEDPNNGMSGRYVEIVGNGDGFYDRSNARTLDWNGNQEVAGDVVAYGCGGANPISLANLNSQMGVKASTNMALAAYPIDSASGSVASFSDGADGIPAKDMIIGIEPVQSGSGDPSPNNVRPISGWTGANVANISDSEKQPYFAGLFNGTYGFVDLGTLNWTNSSSRFYAQLTQAVTTDGKTTINAVCSKYQWSNVYGTRDKTFFISEAHYLSIWDSAYTDAATFKAAMSGVYLIYELNTPTTPTITSAQYNQLLASFNLGGWLTPISWQSEAGTVYGGTLDVATGVLTVDRAMITPTNVVAVSLHPSTGLRFWTITSALQSINLDANNNSKFMSNMFIPAIGVVSGHFYVTANGKTLVVVPYADQQSIDNINDASLWMANSGAYFVYPLAAPVTYQCTPVEVQTLLGANTIYADTGDINVTYRADPTLYNGTVKDVQVNGVSVVSDGVANVPIASSSVAGVAMINNAYGITVMSNKLAINAASPDSIKGGIIITQPLVPFTQHMSAFYGLAKAAGDSTQSASSNAVGTYTPEAKAAIKDMLGITEGMNIVTVTGTAPTINAASNTQYLCGEVLSLNFTPSANGICDVIFTSGSTQTVLTMPATVKMPEWFEVEANKIYEISVTNGVYGAVMVWENA